MILREWPQLLNQPGPEAKTGVARLLGFVEIPQPCDPPSSRHLHLSRSPSTQLSASACDTCAAANPMVGGGTGDAEVRQTWHRPGEFSPGGGTGTVNYKVTALQPVLCPW